MYHLLALPLIGDVLQTWYSRFGLRVALKSLVHNPMVITDEQLDWSASSLSRRENRRQFLYQLRLASKIQLIDKALGVHGPIAKSLPINIFWGRHDSLFPIPASFELQGLLGCGPPDIFEDSGHIPQLEQPEKFNAALREFLLSLALL
jgi:pimeloyl-ACP methyl ester carboxylesterase